MVLQACSATHRAYPVPGLASFPVGQIVASQIELHKTGESRFREDRQGHASSVRVDGVVGKIEVDERSQRVERARQTAFSRDALRRQLLLLVVQLLLHNLLLLLSSLRLLRRLLLLLPILWITFAWCCRRVQAVEPGNPV